MVVGCLSRTSIASWPILSTDGVIQANLAAYSISSLPSLLSQRQQDQRQEFVASFVAVNLMLIEADLGQTEIEAHDKMA